MPGNLVANAYAGFSIALSSHFFSHAGDIFCPWNFIDFITESDIAAYFLGSVNKFYSKYSSKSWINSIIINSIISIEPR